MKPLDWITSRHPSGLITRQADDGSAKWTIRTGRAVADILYQPAMLGTYQEASNEEKTIRLQKEFCRNNRRLAVLNAQKGWPSDIGFAENTTEGKSLIEFIRSPTPFDNHRGVLMQLGFVIEDENPDREYWALRNPGGSLTLDVRRGHLSTNIYCQYHGSGARKWHNVFSLNGDSNTDPVLARPDRYDSAEERYTIYPHDNDRPAIAAAYLNWLIGERKARQRSRFSTPIGGKQKPYR